MPDVHFGIPPKAWEGWESQLVHFHSFESLPSEKKGIMVPSPTFSCFDHEWRLQLYPGGNKSSADGMVGLHLSHSSSSKVSIQYSISIKCAHGKVTMDSECDTFEHGDGWGWYNFAKRADIIKRSNKTKILNNGTLTIEVRMKLADCHYNSNFVPGNTFAKNMLQSFMDEDTADITFEVKGVSFPAHKVILQFCARGSTLASLCEDGDKAKPVPVVGVDPEVFRQMMYYVYGGHIAADAWEEKSKDIMDAADLFGLQNVKIEAEAWYVKHLKLTIENVAQELDYADKKNCFLLKEAALNFILKQSAELLDSDVFEKMPKSQSMLREIFSVAMMGKQNNGPGELAHPANLSINELRAWLHAEGKEIDGPRNKLIAQLHEEEEESEDDDDDTSEGTAGTDEE